MARTRAVIVASGLQRRPDHSGADAEAAASVSAAPFWPFFSQRALAAAVCLAGPAGAECLALGDLGYVLPVEGEVAVTEEPGRPGLLLDFAPGGRAPKMIWLFSRNSIEPTGEAPPESRDLPNGLVAHYGTRVDQGEGSGGSEVMLSGWLEGDASLGVACWTQQEYPSPEWCLPILGELRPETDGCEMKED